MRTHLALLGFLVFAGAAMAADEPKPVIATDDKTIEASVVIDPALKSYPALYDKLLASGKREYDKARAGAAAEFKSTPDLFGDGRKFFYRRTDKLRSAIGSYISVLRSDDTFEGGAHPNHVIDTLLWDMKAARFVNIKPFFKEMTDGGPTLERLARLIRAALAVEKKARDIEVANPDTDQWISAVKPKITDIGGIALAPSTEAGRSSGFVVYFSPYAVGPYAEGEFIVFIPYTAFQSALSPAGLALFGGTRPKSDEAFDER
ncbi:RsiV family protein [Undibacter mobilis]|uniref:DUF3298 domain-containing protein n=1 Tax=Undibacter mobilis TaxID=2292256 RepID=A0A371B3N6_9BRAD|nr:RsiV family protein [Undibacter mobilis]RDV02198.1 DUF3298 domain-containing protein [Undibacter mobilis]